jgi:hypothetical protein
LLPRAQSSISSTSEAEHLIPDQAQINFKSASTQRWQINSGAIQPGGDNSYMIGTITLQATKIFSMRHTFSIQVVAAVAGKFASTTDNFVDHRGGQGTKTGNPDHYDMEHSGL